MLKNKIHIDSFWASFCGNFPENDLHRHYYIEISFAINGKLTINTGSSDKVYNCCLIKSGVMHKYKGDCPHFSLLIDPLSPIALHLIKKFTQCNIIPFCDGWIEQLKRNVIRMIHGQISYESFIVDTGKLMDRWQKSYSSECDFIDKRIVFALKYLKENSSEVISLIQASELTHLSSSRFLHLFKQETGVSFRRFQIWNKLVQAFKLFSNDLNLTQIAHYCGFTDSAHFCRRFKETFGTSPKIFHNNNQFIQV